MIETVVRASIVGVYISALISSILLFVLCSSSMIYEEDRRIINVCKIMLSVSLIVHVLSLSALLIAMIVSEIAK